MELTKVTSKGQVVIPSHIRRELRLDEGTPLVVSQANGFVIMKKIVINDPAKEFAALSAWGEKFAKRKGIKSEEDVQKIIQRGRRRA